jgi:hypothetical protein
VSDRSLFALSVCSEEDRGAKDSPESSHLSSVLRSALLDPEGVQHLRRTPEAKHPALLAYGERRKEERNEPVLTPPQFVRTMSSDLKQEVFIPSPMEKLPGEWTLYGQAAQDERSGGEAEVLIGLLPFQADTCDRVGTTELLF